MPQPSLLRLVRSSVLQTLILALAVFSANTGTAYATGSSTDWSGIQAAMGTDGAVLPGDVLRFQLVRNDTPYSVNGVPVYEGYIGSVTNGFVAFKEKRDGRFYVDGALPAQESELSSLQDSLLQHRQFHITAIYNHVTNLSPQLTWVHFEATGSGVKLATWIAAALETIHNPHLGVFFVPGSNNVLPPGILPPEFVDIFNEGYFATVESFFVFWLPRPDENRLTLDDRVKAQTGLGVGQTFYINIDFSASNTNAIINVDFALREDELAAVQSILRTGGFTLPSLSTNYVSANHPLYYLHATGSGDGFALGATLFKAIAVIGRNNGGGGGNGGGNGGHGDDD